MYYNLRVMDEGTMDGTSHYSHYLADIAEALSRGAEWIIVAVTGYTASVMIQVLSCAPETYSFREFTWPLTCLGHGGHGEPRQRQNLAVQIRLSRLMGLTGDMGAPHDGVPT